MCSDNKKILVYKQVVIGTRHYLAIWFYLWCNNKCYLWKHQTQYLVLPIVLVTGYMVYGMVWCMVHGITRLFCINYPRCNTSCYLVIGCYLGCNTTVLVDCTVWRRAVGVDLESSLLPGGVGHLLPGLG